jgi:hypothetical protein
MSMFIGEVDIMLKGVNGTNIIHTCNSCGKENIFSTLGKKIEFSEELNEYINYPVSCECGAIEVFNMNIPVDDTDESFATGDLPLNEEIQRYYVRILIRLIREDFINGN